MLLPVFNCSKINLHSAEFRARKAIKCDLAITGGRTPENIKNVEKLFYVQVSGDSVMCAVVPEYGGGAGC